MQKVRTSQLPHHLLPETVDLAVARERHQADLARLAGLEAHGRPGWNVEPMPARLSAIERKGRIGLGEVIVRADLDWPVARVAHLDGDRCAAGIDLDLALGGDDLAGNQEFLLR